MPTSAAMAQAIWELLFQASAITGIARDNTAPATSFYLSLHTGGTAPTTQSSFEATYTGYTRKACVRSGSGFTVSGRTLTNFADLVWDAACSAGSDTITYVGIGRDSGSGTGLLMYYGAISPTLAVVPGITPKIVAGAVSITMN